jgi:hypothetical protein
VTVRSYGRLRHEPISSVGAASWRAKVRYRRSRREAAPGGTYPFAVEADSSQLVRRRPNGRSSKRRPQHRDSEEPSAVLTASLQSCPSNSRPGTPGKPATQGTHLQDTGSNSASCA